MVSIWTTKEDEDCWAGEGNGQPAMLIFWLGNIRKDCCKLAATWWHFITVLIYNCQYRIQGSWFLPPAAVVGNERHLYGKLSASETKLKWNQHILSFTFWELLSYCVYKIWSWPFYGFCQNNLVSLYAAFGIEMINTKRLLKACWMHYDFY